MNRSLNWLRSAFHTHNDDRMTIGCPACIARVKLDQDVHAATSGDRPPRRPDSRRHIALLVLVRTYGHDDSRPVASADDVLAWIVDWVGHPVETYIAALHAYSVGVAHPGLARRAVAAGIESGVVR